MPKLSPHLVAVAVTMIFGLGLPGAAQAGARHDDCLDRMFRDAGHTMTRIVHHADRTMTEMFRWCDRRK